MEVFISYKAEDRARVVPLVQALESDGLSVWWDAHIAAGDEWRDTILRHLEAAACAIVIWSKRSVGPEGRFVRDEASRALHLGTYLPVRIDKVQPPLGFGENQALDLRGWKGDRSDPRYQAVLGAARARFGITDGPAGEPIAGPKIDRRAMVVGAGAVAVTAAGAGVWFLAKPAAAASDSIAVLPFANLSGDPAQAYFSDGIAEELRSALSRIAELQVVARTSSEAVRDADAKTAASKLGVANILTGSVRRTPAMLRINAQLVDGRDGVERWSEIYDRTPGDSLRIQSDIANKVAEALSIRLGGADRERIAEGGTDNPEAHDLLLKAEAYVQQNEGAEAWTRGIGMLDAALSLDPNYADALAAKAWMVKVMAGVYASSAQESQRLYQEAATTAQRAVRLAPQSRAGYSVLGDILAERLHPRQAFAQYKKMAALPGGDANALRGYAVFLGEIGRTEEALELIDRSIAADPLNGQSLGWKAYILAAARRYPEAIDVTRRVMELTPSRNGPRVRLGYYHMLLGRYPEAAAAMDVPTPGSIVSASYKAALAVRMGDKAEAERLLTEVRGAGDYAFYQIAQVLAQLGREDDAIEALESAWRSRDSGLTMILIDPLLDPLRDDPRFQAIVRRIDFPT